VRQRWRRALRLRPQRRARVQPLRRALHAAPATRGSRSRPPSTVPTTPTTLTQSGYLDSDSTRRGARSGISPCAPGRASST
jgi:hypothetical protein